MKKLIAFLLAMLLVASMAACGSEKTDPTDSTTQPQQTNSTQPQQTQPSDPETEEVFSFTYEGVELIPGAAFDPAVLPEADPDPQQHAGTGGNSRGPSNQQAVSGRQAPARCGGNHEYSQGRTDRGAGAWAGIF